MNAPTLAEQIRGALWGMFVGDARAMPVHCYYDLTALQHDFGVIRDFPLARFGHADAANAPAIPAESNAASGANSSPDSC